MLTIHKFYENFTLILLNFNIPPTLCVEALFYHFFSYGTFLSPKVCMGEFLKKVVAKIDYKFVLIFRCSIKYFIEFIVLVVVEYSLAK